ncbi:hypothetical protein QZM64_40450, partial [Burkholderia cepacia]|uniref:hypothetical protein n=1 Tax=Burkholderia cepacia TaxID=292 RepID=UPI00264EEF23
RLHVAVLLGSLFGRLVLETRFSRIPLANRRLQPSTTPGTLPDFVWSAKNRQSILDTWQKRYGAKTQQ